MNFRKLDERWAKFGASDKELAEEVTFVTESLPVPGEEPLTVRFCGDHLTREPLDYLRDEEFEIERAERSKMGLVERIRAVKPQAVR